MQSVLLALYDPSQPSADGSFWSWYSPNLDRKLLDRLYYDIASVNRPSDPNQLAPTSVIGGFASMSSGYVFVYRFGDGGRDAHGRPGRFVLLVAAVKTGQLRGEDLAEIITCPVFEELLALAPSHCPVPMPSKLEFIVDAPDSHIDLMPLATVLMHGYLELSGADVVSQAAHICASLPLGREWQCHIRLEGDTSEAVMILSPANQLPVQASLASSEQSLTGTGASKPIGIKAKRRFFRLTWNRRRTRIAMVALMGIIAMVVVLMKRQTVSETDTAPLGQRPIQLQPLPKNGTDVNRVIGKHAGEDPKSPDTPSNSGNSRLQKTEQPSNTKSPEETGENHH